MTAFSIGPVVRPNATVSKRVMTTLILGWLFAIIAVWVVLTLGHDPHGRDQLVPLIPSPAKVGTAFIEEWKSGSIYQLLVSASLSLQAVFLASVIGLGLCYLSTMPLFRAPVDWIGKARFLSLTGLLVVFIMMTKSGHALKLSVLTFSILTFFVNNMMQVIEDIPESRFDYARTLGLSQWQVLREVVIRGTLADAFETIRMNAAMAWMMLSAVEGISRSEGGIGVLLVSLQRSGNYAAIFGLQLMIFLVGIGQDRIIKAIKAMACPYTVRK